MRYVKASDEKAPGTAEDQRRPAAKRVSYDQTKVQPYSGPGFGKLGGLDGKATGAMNTGGKSRPGHNARKGID